MVTLMVSGDAAKNNKLKPTSFAFPSDYERAASWFSEYFEQTVIVRHVPEGIPDDGLATGPTIVSTASLRSVCDLFPGVEVNARPANGFAPLSKSTACPRSGKTSFSAKRKIIRYVSKSAKSHSREAILACDARSHHAIPHRRRYRRLPEKVQRNAPQFPASIIAHRPLRPFLSPRYQHPRPVHGTRQTVTHWRRPGAVKNRAHSRRRIRREHRGRFTVSNDPNEPGSIFGLLGLANVLGNAVCYLPSSTYSALSLQFVVFRIRKLDVSGYFEIESECNIGKGSGYRAAAALGSAISFSSICSLRYTSELMS